MSHGGFTIVFRSGFSLFLQPVEDFADFAEGYAYAGVGGAVIYAHLVALGQCCAWEHHVGHVACEFVDGSRSQQVVLGASQHLPGLVLVEQYGTHGIAISVAGGNDAVVEHEPALLGEYRHAAGTHFGALPCALLKGHGRHDVPMLAPELHVGRETQEDVAEGRMSVVAGARQQRIFPAYLCREEHTVAVEGQQGILALIEGLEVFGEAHSDGRSVVAVAPCNPVLAVKVGDAWVVLVVGVNEVVAEGFEVDGLGVDAPVESVVGEACKDVHLHATVVAAKHSSKAVLEGHHGTVEDTV